MEQKKFRKKGGRPRLPDSKRRYNVTVMLTPSEVEQLRKEYDGHLVDFGVFLREKLLDREAITLSKPIDPEVRAEMTNLLKMTGSMLLIAKRTEYDVLISKEFAEMAAQLRGVVQKAYFHVNELMMSKSLMPNLIRQIRDLKTLVLRLQDESTDIKSIVELLGYITEIEGKLSRFGNQFGILNE